VARAALVVDRVLRPAARVSYIWARLAPILLSYLVTFVALSVRAATAAEREIARRALHAANAPRVLALINDVKGGYVKVGQV
jgi:predicted unusual protein kinase regulating ubiquinone biosynthesis (AarF/ABC1/UbiB family)